MSTEHIPDPAPILAVPDEASEDWDLAQSREQDWPKGALYVIATPIGNLRDITLRALDCIKRLDALGAEDTRLTQRLLAAYHVRCLTFALHQHNEREQAATVIARLEKGERVGYVSDAGTPGISDPGSRLVSAVRGAGHRVIPIPGVSALTAAVSVAGLPDAPILFLGFLPAKAPAARQLLTEIDGKHANLVLYEAPHRILATLQLLTQIYGPQRRAFLGRELTKQFETLSEGPLAELAANPDVKAQNRGEFVVVLHAEAKHNDDTQSTDRMLSRLLLALPLSEAVAITAELTDAPRKAVYARALKIKKDAEPSSE